MDRPTISIYDDQAEEWAGARQPVWRDEASAWGKRIQGLRADLGCGPGQYTADLGGPVVGLDASSEMLTLARARGHEDPLVVGDLAHLPFAAASLAGAWAAMSYHHLPRAQLPMALADLHRCVAAGGLVQLIGLHGEYEGHGLDGDDFPGRFFSAWTAPLLADLMEGAGFSVAEMEVRGRNLWVGAERLETLADTVGPDMDVLVCGINPSLHAARSGVGYTGPGNRFWPAAVEADLVTSADPRRAYSRDRVGMTDLVKRATARAAEVTKAELLAGWDRVGRLVERHQPSVVVFVGLQGWRSVIGAPATPSWQPDRWNGAHVYVMPSTSGLNAATSRDELVAHLRAVRSGRLSR